MISLIKLAFVSFVLSSTAFAHRMSENQDCQFNRQSPNWVDLTTLGLKEVLEYVYAVTLDPYGCLDPVRKAAVDACFPTPESDPEACILRTMADTQEGFLSPIAVNMNLICSDLYKNYLNVQGGCTHPTVKKACRIIAHGFGNINHQDPYTLIPECK